MNIHTKMAAAVLALGVSSLLAGCSSEAPPSPTEAADEGWSVTAWGERYEIFPEVDALVVGELAMAHTHVTALEDFSPMIDGSVEILLRSAGAELSFRASEPVRPGIFNVEIRPDTPGDYDLSFLISSPAGTEEILSGQVRVGTAEVPGSVTRASAPPGAAGGGEPLSFLKEQQWRTDFATVWVRSGSLPQSVEGVARVRPPAGGEATITAPVDAVLLPEPWPYPGRRVQSGNPIFRLVPRVAPDRSLAVLEAERSALEAELSTAAARLERLRGLFEIEATSRREVEEAKMRVDRLGGNLAAAELDLEAAHSAREGGSSGATTVNAPFAGEISAVYASPGEVVAAGAALGRLVKTGSVWLEVAVSPEAGRRLAEGLSGVVVTFPEGFSLRIEEGVRLVSTAPEIDARTGTVAVLLEVPPSEALILGSTVTAQILLSESAEGVVVPASALIDDGGVEVVYLQLSGEEFVRQPVQVTTRQGKRAICLPCDRASRKLRQAASVSGAPTLQPWHESLRRMRFRQAPISPSGQAARSAQGSISLTLLIQCISNCRPVSSAHSHSTNLKVSE